MTVKFKPGVLLGEMHPSLVATIPVVEGVFAKFGVDLVITSVADGDHSDGSYHYSVPVRAYDCRTRHLPPWATPELVASLIREALTQEFDLVVEETHLHLELDP